MIAADLRRAGDIACQSGVKALVYGPPGSGKTPIAATAPNPVLLAIEPGLLSMRGSNIATWEAPTVAKIEEFFSWLFGSAEASQFDTVCVDSISEYAELVLGEELAKPENKHAMQAYGEMSRRVMPNIMKLYYMKQKHMYLICKECHKDNDEKQKLHPYFPGKDLGIKIPHLYDSIWYLSKTQVPGIPTPTLAFRTQGTYNITARDRSGMLAEFEPPNLTDIFNKTMSINL